MFITLEGPEGSGKSSQLPALAEFLRSRGYTVLTRMENQGMSPRSETLLFCAARAQLVDQVIRPALARGEVVISDRYADSTLAYQGYGHGNDLAVLRQLLHFATGGLWPELTLLLDVDSAAGLERRRSSGGEWNRLDDYALSFHQRVRQGYLDLAHSQPERWVVVDAAQPMDAVQQALRQVILRRLEPALS